MVRTPKTGQSRPRRAPVTIDLDADAVKRADAPTDASAGERDTPSAMPAGQAAPEPPVAEATKPEPAVMSERSAPEASGPAAAEPSKSMQADASKPEASRPSEPPHRVADPPGGASVPPPRADKPAPASRTSRGGGSLLAAGFVGGIVALAGAGLLQWGGFLPAPGGDAARVSALEGEVAALRPAAEAAARVDALAQAVDTLQQDVAVLRDAAPSADAGALAALDDRLKAVESGLARLGAAGSGAAVQEADARISALAADVEAAAEAARQGSARVEKLEQAVQALAGRVDAQAQQPKIALSIAAAGLKTALERGAPFVAELETFAAIAPQAPELEALRTHAEAGVPTRAMLAGEMPAAAAAMAAAASPVSDDASLFERLLASAESLISVRPVGDVKGDDPASVVARMEVAVNGGDYGKALAEYEALPEAARQAGAAFAARLKARHEVEQLVDRLIAGAMRS